MMTLVRHVVGYTSLVLFLLLAQFTLQGSDVNVLYIMMGEWFLWLLVRDDVIETL